MAERTLFLRVSHSFQVILFHTDRVGWGDEPAKAPAGLERTSSGLGILGTGVLARKARVASAVSQQETATEQISSSVSSISNLTQASSASADQTAEACANLSELASNLQRLVNEFSVDDEYLTRLRQANGAREQGRMQPRQLAHGMTG